MWVAIFDSERMEEQVHMGIFVSCLGMQMLMIDCMQS